MPQSNSPYFEDDRHTVITANMSSTEIPDWIIWNWETHTWEDITAEQRDTIKAAKQHFFEQLDLEATNHKP